MLRLGLIGTGFGLEVQADAFKYNHIFKMVSVCSKNAAEAKVAKKAAGFSTWYDDWKTLIDKDKLDIVSICTPNYLHYEIAKYAIENDKHVICAAPFTTTAKEAEELAELANRKGKVCVVDHHLNFLPARKFVIKLLKDGKVGRVFTVERNYFSRDRFFPETEKKWQNSAELGGGLFFRNACHDVDYLLRAVGGVKKVSLNTHTARATVQNSEGELTNITADDSFQFHIAFHNGSRGIISQSATSPNKETNEFIFHGEKGSLLLNNDNEIVFYDLNGEKERIAIPPNFQITSLPGHRQRSPFYMFTEVIATAIYNESPVTPTFDEAVHIQRVIQAGLDSNKYHQWIEVGSDISITNQPQQQSQSVNKIFE